ncbi:hypothetical protein ACFVS2_21230 [Brevibacillus sp. NPDC058079]|uniref:hypothetical protein n=1 Tax=Brevibacillus sp. NPDC058079 TaxID=3346330 RepID=UPI0036E0F893
MLGNIFGKFFGKKEQAVKIDIPSIVETLIRRHWEHELVDGRQDVVVVKGKYRNQQGDFSRLFMYFVGGQVQFKDEKGQPITHIPRSVPMNEMYPTMKNILNVI